MGVSVFGPGCSCLQVGVFVLLLLCLCLMRVLLCCVCFVAVMLLVSSYVDINMMLFSCYVVWLLACLGCCGFNCSEAGVFVLVCERCFVCVVLRVC